MNRPLTAIALCAVLAIAACATPGRVRTSLAPKAPLEGPREVSIVGRRSEVERSLEDSLRGRGFQVKRYVSTVAVTDQTAPTRSETYNEGSTRYVLELDWAFVDRCFGGGFRFDFITVDVVDLRVNETVLSMRASGYSEKCQPLSGHIFGGIVEALDAAWVPRTVPPPPDGRH
jgi:hypothetical protein